MFIVLRLLDFEAEIQEAWFLQLFFTSNLIFATSNLFLKSQEPTMPKILAKKSIPLEGQRDNL